ncbi:MAG: triosephosphate isomerase [Herbiconiux sp.]|uniref:triose-phosphate isomerase family protein n=1 Tax=Herbiconiux sp. TaxID=1871186 RepID=UPI00120933B2|nr:triose-phosphate isomerase family protein [Herbiconiux sp.]TAJ46435.1 MAG: triosephosphate isomerase [Herbiconiux sp.]
MLPTTLIGCSSKSYFTASTATEWLDIVSAGLAEMPLRGEGVFLCVPFPLVTEAIRVLKPLNALVGTQDVSSFPSGPYTGEVSAELLSGLGSRFAMVGHPERVKNNGEGPADFASKSEAAAAFGIVPILVVGEPERGADPEQVIRPQLDAAFGRVDPRCPVVVAYEPTWAIGQAEPAPGEHVVGVVARIRELLADMGRAGTRVLYGGSAGPGTFDGIARAGRAAGNPAGVPDGVFLGRAGVDPHGFLATVTEVRAATGS